MLNLLDRLFRIVLGVFFVTHDSILKTRVSTIRWPRCSTPLGVECSQRRAAGPGRLVASRVCREATRFNCRCWACAGLHEFNEIGFFSLIQVQRLDLRAQMFARMASLVVPLNDLLKCRDLAIVHVRCSERNIADRRCLECTHVNSIF